MPNTTTVLTIELPVELGDRLREALRREEGRSLRDLTIEALEEWLERHKVDSSPLATQAFRMPED